MPKSKQTNKAINDKVFTQVSNIIQFMGESNLSEISLETTDLKLELRKNGKTVVQTVSQQPEVIHNQTVTLPVKLAQEVKKEEVVEDNFEKITSPMTGTFYRAPSPTSEPYVEEGSKITKGQTVCIVEAMKMMNEIKSEFNGTIKKILIENATPVEKGSLLFQVEKED